VRGGRRISEASNSDEETSTEYEKASALPEELEYKEGSDSEYHWEYSNTISGGGSKLGVDQADIRLHEIDQCIVFPKHCTTTESMRPLGATVTSPRLILSSPC